MKLHDCDLCVVRNVIGWQKACLWFPHFVWRSLRLCLTSLSPCQSVLDVLLNYLCDFDEVFVGIMDSKTSIKIEI